jgi:Predicted xylanase/chitin deacetylase
LTDKKQQDSGFSFYIPLVLITAFMLGCLSVSLISVRENVMQITYSGSVSASDASKNHISVRKSPVMDDAGLKYRMVSASDLNIRKDENVKKTEAVPTSSDNDLTSADDFPSSVDLDDSSKAETAANVIASQETVSSASSAPEVSEEPEAIHLELPNDRYINFTPHREGYVAYLTFDDGPSEYTEDILDILDYYNVKATFFVMYHKDMADKYKAIVDRGHTIALHTYTHDYKKVYRSETAFFNEISRIQTYVYRVTGKKSRILRFPGGSSNTVSRHYCEGIMDTLKKSVPARGFVYHDWNVDSCDAEAYNMAPEKLLANVQKSLTKYRKPDILMHDAGASKRTTVEALPMIIEYIYSKGYSMEGLQLDSYAVHHDW